MGEEKKSMESNKYTKETIKRAKELREKSGLTFTDISKRTGIPARTINDWAKAQNWSQPPLKEILEAISDPTDPKVLEIEALERKLQSTKADHVKLKTIHKALQTLYSDLKERVGIAEEAGIPEIEPIKKKESSGETEATAFMVASDWHFEEEVLPETVNMLNEYNVAIAEERAKRFFQNGLRLTEIVARDVNMTTLCVPLLGDFITGDIHEENRESTGLLPMEALRAVQKSIASGINFLLEETNYKLKFVCHGGNHARTTKRIFISTEHGHSLEYLMYQNLADLYEGNDRVEFQIIPAYHSYMDVYHMTLRFHHGHAIRYAGGVGGIYIPVNKAIAQWNKARHADLDVFGHFHQAKDGGNFVTNGSNIGFNPFAIRIKADYELPKQVFFTIDSKRGRTFTCPIIV